MTGVLERCCLNRDSFDSHDLSRFHDGGTGVLKEADRVAPAEYQFVKQTQLIPALPLRSITNYASL